MADTTQSESFLGRFLVLKGAARELWITFAVKFLGVTAYKLMNVILVLWHSSDFGETSRRAKSLLRAVGSQQSAVGGREQEIWNAKCLTSSLTPPSPQGEGEFFAVSRNAVSLRLPDARTQNRTLPTVVPSPRGERVRVRASVSTNFSVPFPDLPPSPRATPLCPNKFRIVRGMEAKNSFL